MPAGTEILFIKKTARHVQRGSHNRAPLKTLKPDDVLYQLPDSWPIEPVLGGSNSPPIGRQKQRSLLSARKAKGEVRTDNAADALQALQLSPEPQKLAPLNTLSGGVGDPFDSLKAPMSPYMENLFKVYSSDVVPRIFPIKEVAKTARLYTLTQAFEDPLQRDTLLCTTSAAIYADSGVTRHGIAGGQDTLAGSACCEACSVRLSAAFHSGG